MTRLMLILWLNSLEFVDDKVYVDPFGCTHLSLWMTRLMLTLSLFVDEKIDVDPVVVLT